MTLPTGSISFSNLNTELNRAANAPISLNDSQVRLLNNTGNNTTISMASLQGKSFVRFDLESGTYSFEDDGGCSFSINCNIPALWNYSRSGASVNTYNTPASGQTATTLSLSTNATDKFDRTATWTITATAGGITKNYVITLTAHSLTAAN